VISTPSSDSAGKPPAPTSVLKRIQSIVAPAFKVSALELLVQALAFFAMVVRFRYFGATVMGLVSYFGALGEMPAAFYSHFNRGLIRFVPLAKPQRKLEILLACLFFQTAIIALIFAILGIIVLFFPAAALWRQHLSVDGRDAGFVATYTAVIVVLAMFQAAMGAMTSGLHKYTVVQGVKAAQSLAQLLSICALILVARDKRMGLWMYYSTTVGIYLCFSSYLAFRVAGWSSLKTHLDALSPSRWKGILASVYRENFRLYTLPLQFSAIFAYVKENLAVLFLGQMGLMSDAGVYNLANKIYGLPRKFIPGIVGLMMPKFVTAAEADPVRFRKKFTDYAWLQFVFHVLLATAIFASLPLLRVVFKTGSAPGLALVFFLFSSNLALNSIIQTNLNIIDLGKDMRWYLMSSMIRTVVVTAITAVLVPKLGNVGATLSLIISTVVIFFLLAFDTRKTKLWNWNDNIWQFLIWIGAMGVWSLLFLVFPKTFPTGW
jgi:O-antigen/teichoic acid export membrane protein